MIALAIGTFIVVILLALYVSYVVTDLRAKYDVSANILGTLLKRIDRLERCEERRERERIDAAVEGHR